MRPQAADILGGVATFSSVTARHVLQAIAEHDDRGTENFLGLYGFSPTPGYALVHEGRSYDPAAVLGVAHRYATGRAATAEEFRDGLGAAVALLRRRGFEVTEPAKAAAPARRSAATRTPRTTTPRQPAAPRRPVVVERPTAICPTCSMALPATGVCDSCS